MGLDMPTAAIAVMPLSVAGQLRPFTVCEALESATGRRVASRFARSLHDKNATVCDTLGGSGPENSKGENGHENEKMECLPANLARCF